MSEVEDSQKQKEARQKYYLENKEKIDEYNKKWRIENKEKLCEYSKKWRIKNGGKDYDRKQRNTIKRQISKYKNSAKRHGREFNLTESEVEFLCKGCCGYCGYQKDKKLNGIDRMDNNYDYELWNCISCCKICNWAKNDLEYGKFEKWLKRLIKFNNE